MIDWSRYPNFSREEFLCHCGCGLALMDVDFLRALQELRTVHGYSMRISSGYRCPDHNEQVSTTGRDGPHTTGKACDIAESGARARTIIGLAIVRHGFTGIGVAQRGRRLKRFVHLDTLISPPRPNIWSY